MSLSDLEKMKLLKPEKEWTGHAQRSEVQPVLTALTSALGVTGCIFMWLGNGHALTWIGLLMFSVFLGSFTWVNLKGVCKS